MSRKLLAKMVSWLKSCHMDGCALVYSVLPPTGCIIDALLTELDRINEISSIVWSNCIPGKETQS